MHYNVPSSRTGHSLRSDECIYASVLGVKTNVSLLLGKSANRNPLGCETVNKPRLPSAELPRRYSLLVRKSIRRRGPYRSYLLGMLSIGMVLASASYTLGYVRPGLAILR